MYYTASYIKYLLPNRLPFHRYEHNALEYSIQFLKRTNIYSRNLKLPFCLLLSSRLDPLPVPCLRSQKDTPRGEKKKRKVGKEERRKVGNQKFYQVDFPLV